MIKRIIQRGKIRLEGKIFPIYKVINEEVPEINLGSVNKPNKEILMFNFIPIENWMKNKNRLIAVYEDELIRCPHCEKFSILKNNSVKTNNRYSKGQNTMIRIMREKSHLSWPEIARKMGRSQVAVQVHYYTKISKKYKKIR